MERALCCKREVEGIRVGGMDERERMMGMESKRKAGRAGQGSKRE